MSYTKPQDDGQIGRVHSMALREEIGERLRVDPDRALTDTPPHLLQLMKCFHDETAGVRWLDA
jgi:hypothetical protein